MQTFLVGGAVRDSLLDRKVIDRDWVVVGATPSDMLDLGYQQVGNDFPVFLHPKSKEEYALARIERKNGNGYLGFTCDASKDVTIEQDLLRRDLTINAMAQDTQGKLVDPYNGQKDLNNRILRHVSDAFVEDPLRVLRVARFAARYHSYGFTIADETMELMRHLCDSGEIHHLTPERVWKETSRSLLEPNPEVYFETLRECGALAVWLPEIAKLWGIPNPAQWHPEIDTGIHTMMVLQQSALLSDQLTIRYAALVHDLGKGLTDPDLWPSHRGHEKLGLSAINDVSDRLKVPNECRELALLVSEFHSHIHRAFELKPSTVLSLFNKADAWRKPDRFEQLLLTCKADARGRTGFENDAYTQADYIRGALDFANTVDVKSIIAAGYQGAQIKQQLDHQKIAKIKEYKQDYYKKSEKL